MSALGAVCAPAVVALEAAIVAAPASFPTSRRLNCVADTKSSHGIRLPFFGRAAWSQFLIRNACFPRWTVVQLWKTETAMSAFGQKRTFAPQKAMSALPPKADTRASAWHVRYGP